MTSSLPGLALTQPSHNRSWKRVVSISGFNVIGTSPFSVVGLNGFAMVGAAECCLDCLGAGESIELFSAASTLRESCLWQSAGRKHTNSDPCSQSTGRPFNQLPIDRAPTPPRVLFRHPSQSDWAMMLLMTGKPVSPREFWPCHTLARLTGTRSVAQPTAKASRQSLASERRCSWLSAKPMPRPSHDGSSHFPVSPPNAGKGALRHACLPVRHARCVQEHGCRQSATRSGFGKGCPLPTVTFRSLSPWRGLSRAGEA